VMRREGQKNKITREREKERMGREVYQAFVVSIPSMSELPLCSKRVMRTLFTDFDLSMIVSVPTSNRPMFEGEMEYFSKRELATDKDERRTRTRRAEKVGEEEEGEEGNK
jgi:hypothetical protein